MGTKQKTGIFLFEIEDISTLQRKFITSNVTITMNVGNNG